MKRLKGPELKMPDVKVPPFLQDLYWDLRDRRLLPFVALIIVAIVAVPILLGGDSESESPPADPTASISAELENARASDLVVVRATPGLRDYHKRLAGRTPKDPFIQPAQTPRDTKGAQIVVAPEETATSSAQGETSAAPSGSPAEEPASNGSDSGSASPQPPSSPDSDSPSQGHDGNGKQNLTFYTFAIDARITHTGGKGTQADPVVKERILPLTALPGEKAPVVTYMGASKKGKALLMVSNDVKSVFGETKCISGNDVCQLLEAEPGFPATFIYGNGEAHYTIKVLKIYPVVTGRN
jgi:hypothetical protein